MELLKTVNQVLDEVKSGDDSGLLRMLPDNCYPEFAKELSTQAMVDGPHTYIDTLAYILNYTWLNELKREYLYSAHFTQVFNNEVLNYAEQLIHLIPGFEGKDESRHERIYSGCENLFESSYHLAKNDIYRWYDNVRDRKLIAAFYCMLETNATSFISVFAQLPTDYDRLIVLSHFYVEKNTFIKLFDGFIALAGEYSLWYCAMLLSVCYRFETEVPMAREMLEKHKNLLGTFAVDFFTARLPVTAIKYSHLWDEMVHIFSCGEIIREILSRPASLTGLYSCVCLYEKFDGDYPNFFNHFADKLILWIESKPVNFQLNIDLLDNHFTRFITIVPDILCASSVDWREPVKVCIVDNMPCYWGWFPKGYDYTRENRYLFLPVSIIYICAITRLYGETKDLQYIEGMRWYFDTFTKWIPESLSHTIDIRLGGNLVCFAAEYDGALDAELLDFFNVILSPSDFARHAQLYCACEKAAEGVKKQLSDIWCWKKKLINPDNEIDREAALFLDNCFGMGRL